jgi:uncharacterized RDD family membrane protein YckC
MGSMAQEYRVGTPEAVDISYAIAGIGSRFVAALVDFLIWLVLQIVVILGSVGIMQLPSPGPTIGTVLLLTVSFVLFWGYFILFETMWSGQTPGKRVLHIRVIKTTGYPIGFAEAAIRNLVRLADFLPSMYAVGVITMFINPNSRRLGDLAAGTVVVKERPRVRMRDVPVAPQVPGLVAPVGSVDPGELEWNLRALDARDIQILSDYLVRGAGFPADARDRIGREVAEMVAIKIGARVPLDPGPFLRRVRDLSQ